ncbi:MAG: hypothetical protein IJZ83_05480 [Clostridia bacterium]|nr:hypothetical protein [Clostridia bacterium]
MNNENNKTKDTFANILKKTSDIGKKAADQVQKGAKIVSEQTKKNIEEHKKKKYNPIFPKDFRKKDFCLPNIIEIVDDAVRREIDYCEGAIGWCDTRGETEVFHLYDEWVENSGIQFVPFWKCDNVYCVDAFDRKRYINVNSIFAKATEEKLAELANIAFCLGAKSCSVEILEANLEIEAKSLKANAKVSNTATSFSNDTYTKNKNMQSGKTISHFEGNSSPKRPELKWFQYDDTIKGLIDMRCSNANSIKSKTLELSGSCSATMSKKTAIAIDKILKVKGSVSMEKQVQKEISSKLIFEIEF